jgi:beta-lactamase class D
MMFLKKVDAIKLFGKRGSNKLENEGRFTGWFTGFIESQQKLYFFTSYIESPDLQHPQLKAAQKEIPYLIFEYLNIIKNR